MNEVRTGEGGGSSSNLFSEWLNLLPFPNLCWGRREQMDTGRRGRQVRNEGDGWGTDGVGGKRRVESARMIGKFSTWPWVEKKICMRQLDFGMHHFYPQSLVGHPSSPVCPRGSTEPEPQFSGGDGCCRRASALCSSPVLVMAGEECVQTQYPKGAGMWWVSQKAQPTPKLELTGLKRYPTPCLFGSNGQNTQSDLWFYLLKARHSRWPDFQNMLSICALRCIEL